MATYTDAYGFNKGAATSGPIPNAALHTVGVISVDLDFADITAARLAAGATALGAGDVLAVISLPAKTYVLRAGIDVTTAEGGTLTLDLGDGTDPDGFLDGVDGNAVASYASTLALTEAAPNTVTGYSNGKYYSAADTIDLVMVNATDTAVMRVWALVAYVG